MALSFKYYRTTPLIIIILVSATLLDKLVLLILDLLSNNGIELEVIRIPSNVVIISSFLVIYNILLWKLPVFKFLVNVPNLNGRYAGKIEYFHKDTRHYKNCALEVVQNASKIRF